MHLTIAAASTALFSTWVFVENFGLLFDAGDGISASLGQKGRKVRHVFVTHADRDHVCGLLQLHQLNARDGIPHIFYPKDSGSFPALKDFMEKFDPQSGPATWRGLAPGETVPLDKTHFIEARTSEHVTMGDLTKSLDYTLCAVRRSLRPELTGMNGAEIGALRKEHGEDAVTEPQIEKLVGYSGDAPQLRPERWSGVKILFHEATFLAPETARSSHSNLPDVIASAAQLDLEALVLLHFSARYKADEIVQAVRQHAAAAKVGFPVFVILPGQVYSDLLSTEPVWEPGCFLDREDCEERQEGLI
ncbi:MBL fold metallo-hydrolase [Prosthecobacter sp.]|uniref:MBL fold metallo-hydrolase n=1 Tax=Prosthecobacter sp. TaxID=1965333 RepID=UPI003783199A